MVPRRRGSCACSAGRDRQTDSRPARARRGRTASLLSTTAVEGTGPRALLPPCPKVDAAAASQCVAGAPWSNGVGGAAALQPTSSRSALFATQRHAHLREPKGDGLAGALWAPSLVAVLLLLAPSLNGQFSRFTRPIAAAATADGAAAARSRRIARWRGRARTGSAPPCSEECDRRCAGPRLSRARWGSLVVAGGSLGARRHDVAVDAAGCMGRAGSRRATRTRSVLGWAAGLQGEAGGGRPRAAAACAWEPDPGPAPAVLRAAR